MADNDDRAQRRLRSTLTLGLATERRSALQIKPDGEANLSVEVVGGPMDGARCEVPGPVLTIGRHEGSDLTLPLDPSISGQHARIVREGEHFWLEDLNSRNGTYLGDKRIEERTLIGSGTLLTVGWTILEFSAR